MKKLLVTGSRDWTSVSIIRRELEKLYPEYDVLIQGECRGADLIAKAVARQIGYDVKRGYPADWDKYPRAAGPIRNSQMLAEEHPDKDCKLIDLCLAFHEDLDSSKGTKDMVAKAEKAGIKTLVIGE